MAERELMVLKQGICPVCESSQVEGGFIEVDIIDGKQVCLQEMNCLEWPCRGSWREIYDLRLIAYGVSTEYSEEQLKEIEK